MDPYGYDDLSNVGGITESTSYYDPFSGQYLDGAIVPDGNQSDDVQYFGSSNPVNPTPANSNPIGGFFGGLGDALSKIGVAGINAAASNIANKISSAPTFKGNVSGKSTTATAGSILGISAGTLLLIGGIVLAVILIKKR